MVLALVKSSESHRSKILVCDCEKTMHMENAKLTTLLDEDHDLSFHTQLCRRQVNSYEEQIQSGSCLVACTQETPVFLEIAEENEREDAIRFVNIRERAGWSTDKENITAKMAALLAEASYENDPPKVRTLTSDGLCFIYGVGQVAVDVALKLSRHLTVSLILKNDNDIILPEMINIPIYRGSVKDLTGVLGEFRFSIENYASLNPSTRNKLEFTQKKTNETSCSLFLDLSGDPPLIKADEKRYGYYRVAPSDKLAISNLLFDMVDMVGEFEKTIYVDYNPEICAHSRSKITGCNKCLDVCPADALTSSGDHIAVDTRVCAGCGSCSAVCPTGAISYTAPNRKNLIERIQILASSYLKAGGEQPTLLLHDDSHGMPLISIIARHGNGLPGHVIPFSLYSISVIGHDIFAAALSAGFESVVVLCNPKKQDEFVALDDEISLMRDLLTGLAIDVNLRVMKLIESDAQTIETFLYDMAPAGGLKPSLFKPLGTRREIARSAISALIKAAASSAEIIPLSEKAPYGAIEVDQSGCTLCLACVSSCPANALADNPEKPQLRFTEAACVQCGLCQKTCPENVITLKPRLNLTPAAMQPVTLYEEEPFECIRCGAAFGSKSTIERMSQKLAGTHWMFRDERADLLKMCDNCRIEVQAEASGGDPFAFGKRPKVVTTQDYIDAEDEGLSIDDFLMKEEG